MWRLIFDAALILIGFVLMIPVMGDSLKTVILQIFTSTEIACNIGAICIVLGWIAVCITLCTTGKKLAKKKKKKYSKEDQK